MDKRSTGTLLTWSQIRGSDESKLLNLTNYIRKFVPNNDTNFHSYMAARII